MQIVPCENGRSDVATGRAVEAENIRVKLSGDVFRVAMSEISHAKQSGQCFIRRQNGCSASTMQEKANEILDRREDISNTDIKRPFSNQPDALFSAPTRRLLHAGGR